MFRFPVQADDDVGDMFGAVIESVEAEADGRLRVGLLFWDDVASIYVTPGTKFYVWYARTLGDGVLLPWSAGGVQGGADAGVGE